MAYKHIRMKKADWEKWDAALRSGEYVQGKDALRDSNGRYCCLGVLEMVVDGEVEMMNQDSVGPEPCLEPSLNWLADHGIEFRRVNGEPTVDPWLPKLGTSTTAANDGRHVQQSSFVSIADAIKDTVEFTDA